MEYGADRGVWGIMGQYVRVWQSIAEYSEDRRSMGGAWGSMGQIGEYGEIGGVWRR